MMGFRNALLVMSFLSKSNFYLTHFIFLKFARELKKALSKSVLGVKESFFELVKLK